MKLLLVGVATLTVSMMGNGVRADSPVTGEYVESRSANVFVGACHHEGEVQTAGRNAVLAWNISNGEFRGVSLKGVSAVAVVAGDRYLSLPGVKRRSVLYVDAAATAEQRSAVEAFLRVKAKDAIGEVAAVKSAPISFDSRGDMYRVQVAGAAYMKIRKQTQELCCKQPYETWGKPFVPVAGARAGYCVGVEFKDGSLLQAWSATEQNNSFFGSFAL